MATSTSSWKQTLANRLNALKSTGPKTPEGKARSSQNAQTHGLSRVGVHPPRALADAIAERKLLWKHDYRPEGPSQQWLFDRLVAESVRLDFCDARILAARTELAQRASESWDDDRHAELAQLASKLSDRPEVIQPTLLQTKHGVRWMLDRWEEVAHSLRRHEGWVPETWSLALDLLGLSASARHGTGPWDLDPSDNSAAPGLALVEQVTTALRDRLESFLNDRDARARADAEAGLSAADPPPIRLLERYAADARRCMARYLNELRRLQALTSSASSTPPGPRPSRASSPAPNEPKFSTPPTLLQSPPLPNEPNGRPVSGPSAGRSSLRQVVPGASAPLNRRQRRALAAAARRS